MNEKVKLDNTKSRFAKKAEEQKKQEAQFDQSVDDYQKNQAALVKKASELSSQFMSYIKDQRLNLPENKGPVLIEMEKQICKELTDLSLELNQDQSQPEGIGSAGMILLLLKTVLVQRDFINELRYDISKLKKNSSTSSNGE